MLVEALVFASKWRCPASLCRPVVGCVPTDFSSVHVVDVMLDTTPPLGDLDFFWRHHLVLQLCHVGTALTGSFPPLFLCIFYRSPFLSGRKTFLPFCILSLGFVWAAAHQFSLCCWIFCCHQSKRRNLCVFFGYGPHLKCDVRLSTENVDHDNGPVLERTSHFHTHNSINTFAPTPAVTCACNKWPQPWTYRPSLTCTSTLPPPDKMWIWTIRIIQRGPFRRSLRRVV